LSDGAPHTGCDYLCVVTIGLAVFTGLLCAATASLARESKASSGHLVGAEHRDDREERLLRKAIRRWKPSIVWSFWSGLIGLPLPIGPDPCHQARRSRGSCPGEV